MLKVACISVLFALAGCSANASFRNPENTRFIAGSCFELGGIIEIWQGQAYGAELIVHGSDPLPATTRFELIVNPDGTCVIKVINDPSN